MEEANSNPNTYPKEASNKAWIICSAVLFVAVIVLTILFATSSSNNKTDTGNNRVTELESLVEEQKSKIAELESGTGSEPASDDVAALKQQIEEKDAKITELEKQIKESNVTTSVKPVNISQDELVAAAKKVANADSFTEIHIENYDGSKYIVAHGGVTQGFSGAYLFMYKENTSDSQWKEVYTTQGLSSCDSFSSLQKEVLHGIVTCAKDDGSTTKL